MAALEPMSEAQVGAVLAFRDGLEQIVAAILHGRAIGLEPTRLFAAAGIELPGFASGMISTAIESMAAHAALNEGGLEHGRDHG